MLVRRVLILALVGLVFVAGPASAGAPPTEYPPASCAAQVQPDRSVLVTGTNLAPNSPVTAVVRRTGETTVVASVSGTADALGNISLLIPPLAPGSYEISVTCGEVVVLEITIPGGSTTTADVTATSTGNLPRTGSDSLPLVRLALVLLAAGAFAVYAARRRTRQAARI